MNQIAENMIKYSLLCLNVVNVIIMGLVDETCLVVFKILLGVFYKVPYDLSCISGDVTF